MAADKEDDTVPGHESVERSWASNDKVQFDNLISHCKRVDGYAELALKEAITFQQKSNDDYLETAKKYRDEFVKHSADRDSASLENNRYSLDRLYSVFPEETSALVALLAKVREFLEGEKASP